MCKLNYKRVILQLIFRVSADKLLKTLAFKVLTEDAKDDYAKNKCCKY